MANISYPPLPRPAPRRANRPDPGTVNITRRRSLDKLTNDWHILVGHLHIGRRHIDENIRHLVCQVCGHPYDHGGQPHSHAHTTSTRLGEALTGPDGLVYNWDGTVWRKRP